MQINTDNPDFAEMGQEEFDIFEGHVAREADRRRQLAAIPKQIREMAYAYEQGGGNIEDLSLVPLPPEQPSPIIDPSFFEPVEDAGKPEDTSA